MVSRLPRVVVVDHYDSYTRNLLSLLCDSIEPAPSSEELAARVVVIPHTHPALAPENFAKELLPHVDALILSPGPGTSTRDDDFGASAALLRNPELVQMPILGICLGHQGIATTFGGSVRRLANPAHGTKRALTVVPGTSALMNGIDDGTEMVCYNSLVVDENTLPSCLTVTAWSQTELDGRIIQGVQHKTLPYYGVQFHPESIESSAGHLVLKNFIGEVEAYWRHKDESRVSLWDSDACSIPHVIHEYGQTLVSLGRDAALGPRQASPAWKLVERSFSVPDQDLNDVVVSKIPALVARLFRNDGCIWLDSASARNPQSHYSFMSTADFVLTYGMDGQLDACVRQGENVARAPVDARLDSGGLWDWLDQVQGSLQSMTQDIGSSVPNHRMCPFRTGFAGFWSYEMKDESLDLGHSASHYEDIGGKVNRMQLPLAQWAFCNTVLSFDHISCTWKAYALVSTAEPMYGDEDAALNALNKAIHAADPRVSIGIPAASADKWFECVERVLGEKNALNTAPTVARTPPLPPLTALDGHDEYIKRILQAQELICQGESYEICLTTQFEGTVPELEKAADKYAAYFELYLKLRKRNPAPFGAYLELLPTPDGTPQAILSTSPERFLTITCDGDLEMRPIKGTLVRPGYAATEEAWLEQAKTDPEMRAFIEQEDERRKRQLNSDVKERSENLMIADLIRADLQSICFPDSVKVPKLIAIETYETVHQLVTSVVGKMRPGIRCVEATRRCFPPGSMTGAPKKRSVQLLEQLERTPGCTQPDTVRRRGVYSGALGFIGVDGGANFSVVIRTLTAQGAGVTVGAGGAVTFLSTPEGEWIEVIHKLGSLTVMDGA
ncbi:aminodeoxychorismate synthase [Malassezia cuniculi]|uniref:aminodeoxychorismate synthase n=1 Tax=Malassezia cuniculi TaxID=948313 RepID=A0AAF0EU38_9BASI|nr:aminodeoxychorismate synthase [Malassezia cuniculi]